MTHTNKILIRSIIAASCLFNVGCSNSNPNCMTRKKDNGAFNNSEKERKEFVKNELEKTEKVEKELKQEDKYREKGTNPWRF